MQNEMDFFYPCKKFEYNHNYVKLLRKSNYDTLELEVLDNIVYFLD